MWCTCWMRAPFVVGVLALFAGACGPANEVVPAATIVVATTTAPDLSVAPLTSATTSSHDLNYQ